MVVHFCHKLGPSQTKQVSPGHKQERNDLNIQSEKPKRLKGQHNSFNMLNGLTGNEMDKGLTYEAKDASGCPNSDGVTKDKSSRGAS